MELGRTNRLRVARIKEVGAFLTDGETDVLLPRAELAKDTKVGDELEVFIYKDSEDRPIATKVIPPLTVGSAAVLRVSQVNEIGAFLDWGLLKDLFLPFKEQTRKLHEGESVVAVLYVDKSERLAASMKIYRHLDAASGYKKDDRVTGLIYEINRDIGAYVAVDGRYYGMIPKQELYGKWSVGDIVTARITRVRPDGKLNLSGRRKAYAQMDEDAARVLEVIRSYDGVLPFTDKAAPERIDAELGLSKAAFKRAVGRLLKEGQIVIEDDCIKTVY